MFKKVKSFAHKIAISFLLLMLFSITTQVFLSIYSYYQIKLEVTNSNTQKIENIKRSYDMVFLDMEYIWHRLAMNKTLAELQTTAPRSQDYYLSINEFLSEPYISKAQYGQKYDFFLYVKNGDMIITQNSAIDRKDYYKQNINKDVFSLESWTNAMFEGMGKRVVKVTELDEISNNVNRIAFIYPIPNSKVDPPEILLVIFLNESFFTDIYDNSDMLEYVSFSVFDKEGTAIITSDENIALDPQIVPSSNEINVKSLKDKVIFSASSDVGGYIYLIQVESRFFWQKLRIILLFMLVSLLIYMVLGGFLAWILAQKNYNPINDILKFLGFEKRKNYTVDEFDIIKSSIMKNLSEYIKIKSELYNHELVSASLMLSELFNGRYSNAKLKEVSPNLYNDLEDNYYVVMVVKPIVSEADSIDIAYESRQFVINDVLIDLLEADHKVYSTEIDDVVAIATIVDSEYYKNAIDTAASNAQNFVLEKFNIEFTVSVSGVHKGVDNIRTAFLEGMFVYSLRLMLNPNGIEYFEMIDKSKLTVSYQYPMELEESIISYLRNGDYESLEKAVNQLFDINVYGNKMNKNLVHILVVDLMGSVLKALYSFADVPKDIVEMIYNFKELIYKNETEELRHSILELMQLICMVADDNSEKNIVDRTLRIVEREYNNPDLNNDMIARTLSVSPQYLSRTVRSYINKGIPVIIAEKRIEEAKKLINAGMKIEDVANMVGFTNTRSFRRLFVKYTGVTPVEFRSNYVENCT